MSVLSPIVCPMTKTLRGYVNGGFPHRTMLCPFSTIMYSEPLGTSGGESLLFPGFYVMTLLHLSGTTEVYILISKEETQPLAKALKLFNTFTFLNRHSKQATSLGWYEPQINSKWEIPLNALKQNRVTDWAVIVIYMQCAPHPNLSPAYKCCHYWLQIWWLFQWESICHKYNSCFYFSTSSTHYFAHKELLQSRMYFDFN